MLSSNIDLILLINMIVKSCNISHVLGKPQY